MLHLLAAVLLCVLVVQGCAEREPAKVNANGSGETGYKFSAKVKSVSLMAQYQGEVIPPGFDLGYVIVVTNVKPLSGTVPKAEKNQLAFAVHSPTRVFAAAQEQAIGRRWRFTAMAREDGGLLMLQAVPEDRPATQP